MPSNDINENQITALDIWGQVQVSGDKCGQYTIKRTWWVAATHARCRYRWASASVLHTVAPSRGIRDIRIFSSEDDDHQVKACPFSAKSVLARYILHSILVLFYCSYCCYLAWHSSYKQRIRPSISAIGELDSCTQSPRVAADFVINTCEYVPTKLWLHCNVTIGRLCNFKHVFWRYYREESIYIRYLFSCTRSWPSAPCRKIANQKQRTSALSIVQGNIEVVQTLEASPWYVPSSIKLRMRPSG